MSPLPGGRIGPYEILSSLGAGGMGEVYKAMDPRLDRIVALKVLPPDLASDPARLRRFTHESQLLSKLNHPHIVTVHECGQDGSTSYMAMEYVEGRTLQGLLRTGPLPARKLLDVSVQMAAGLASAHEAGIIHRDLKPGNVMLSKDGFVKIVDFGLAKATGGPPATDDSATSTRSHPGQLVGTIEYMSPEQATGDRLDFRSDQFSLGVVLYEMASGIRPFHRETAMDTLAAIRHHEPLPLSKVRPDLPAPLSWIVDRCLSKDPAERFSSTRDLANDLASLREHLVDLAPRRRTTWARTSLSAAAVAVPLVLLGVLFWPRPRPPEAAVRFAVQPPADAFFNSDTARPAPPALSPDSRLLVFGARDPAGRSLLWVRPLDALEARPLPGTENATYPFWSPDSRFIGFFADGKLKKIPAAGGAVQTLGDARDGRGGAWSPKGDIVFAPDNEGPLHRIAAVGGASEAVTRLDTPGRPGLSHRWPQFLPDGERFLYTVLSVPPQPASEVHAGSLRARDSRLLLTNASNAVFVAPNHLLFAREGTLMDASFDPGALTAAGEPIPVAERVHRHRYRRNAAFTATERALVYQSDPMQEGARLVWVDRTGSEAGSVGAPADYGGLRLSPTGDRAAVEIRDSRTGNMDVWILELARGVATRLTSGAQVSDCPNWAPSGDSVLFTSNRSGRFDLYRRALSSPSDELVLLTDRDKTPTDWSADGRVVVFDHGAPSPTWDIWFWSADSKQATPFLATAFNERDGRLSPDGRWIAYASDESGAFEVYVRSFPRPGFKRQVSGEGGSQPVWRRDGKELFYLAANDRLMAVATRLGETFAADAPRPLFGRRLAASSSDSPLYDATPDGRRFLLSVRSDPSVAPALSVVLNWTGDLRH
jgi:eukaryotic-like serine/threonine-protein kinase